MRYNVIRKWLNKLIVVEQDLLETEFTYEELQFIVGFDSKKLALNEPELLKYFKEVT